MAPIKVQRGPAKDTVAVAQYAQLCAARSNPMDCDPPGFNLLEFAQTQLHLVCSRDPIFHSVEDHLQQKAQAHPEQQILL